MRVFSAFSAGPVLLTVEGVNDYNSRVIACDLLFVALS